jgi:hypothetical protein
MESLKQDKKEVVAFPENSPSIISEILEGCGLKEPAEDVFKKIRDGGMSNGGLLAEIIKKIAYDEITPKDVDLFFKESFNLPPEKIKKIEKDIEEKILSKIEKNIIEDNFVQEAENISDSFEKIDLPVSMEKDRPQEKDSYRESIE